MVDLDDLAQDRLGFRERGQALDVRREFRIIAEILDVLCACPLRVVDRAPALLAGVDAGRDEAGLLAEEGFGALLQELDQLLLVVRLNREDVDEGRDVAADANGRFHFRAPVLAVGRGHLGGEQDAGAEAGGNDGTTRWCGSGLRHRCSPLRKAWLAARRAHNAETNEEVKRKRSARFFFSGGRIATRGWWFRLRNGQ